MSFAIPEENREQLKAEIAALDAAKLPVLWDGEFIRVLVPEDRRPLYAHVITNMPLTLKALMDTNESMRESWLRHKESCK